jgi:hypothetical protein
MRAFFAGRFVLITLWHEILLRDATVVIGVRKATRTDLDLSPLAILAAISRLLMRSTLKRTAWTA